MIVGGGGKPTRNFTRHEVHRPRPPHVAVTSTPPPCAALRIVVPGSTTSVRCDAAPPRSAMMVRATVIASHSSGMLAPMEIDVDAMKRMAAAAGFTWSDAELEPLRPAVARLLEALARLDSLPLGDLEPTTQYRVL